jgi:polysaccharide biosynthesis protein PslH
MDCKGNWLMAEILFLAHRIPWPADRGDKIRSYNILHKLATFAPVHVGAFADDARDMRFAAEVKQTFASTHIELRTKSNLKAGVEALKSGLPVSVCSFHSSKMQAWVNERLASRKISHIFVFSGQMAQYVPNDFSGSVITDFVDVDSAKFESYAENGNPFMRWVNRREGKLLSAYEKRMAQRVDYSLFVSEAEAGLFRQRSGLSNDKVRALGNGIDTISYDPGSKFTPPKRHIPGKMIVFTGQMDYRPNVEAVCDFATNAFPVIRLAEPKAHFVIVGRNPVAAVQQLRKIPGVIVTGAVEDVRSWLAEAEVVVAPLRIARGIQNKVLEAMAMAKPVVVSPAAAEGISAEHGKHFIIAPDVAAEAQQVIHLLADKNLRQRLGIAARGHVIESYSWTLQLAGLDQLLGANTIFAEAAE